MIDLTTDVHSVTAFKRDIPGFLERMKQSGHPLVLTRNGKADVVVLTAAQFQRLDGLADQMEQVVAIRRALDHVDGRAAGPFEEALDELLKKHGISRSNDRNGGRGSTRGVTR